MEQHQQELKQQERSMTKQGVVNIKGKNYKTVALRVQEFREQFPTYFLTTEIVKIDDEQCIVKAYAGVHLEGGQVQTFATGLKPFAILYTPKIQKGIAIGIYSYCTCQLTHNL